LVVILAEACLGALFVHYVFNVSWFISILVALSFATVGEAVLLPILDEFRLTKTRLGQTILGIGVLDDVIEVATVIIMTVLLGLTVGHAHSTISVTIIVLLTLFGLTYLFTRLKNKAGVIHFKGIASFFLFVVFFIFAFIGIGIITEAAALGALLAGMALKNFIPDKRRGIIDSEIRTMAYGFFAPIFFLWVGVDTNITFLVKYPLLIISLVLLINSIKIGASYLMGRKIFGAKPSIVMGVGLTIKLSTSIVIIKLLYEKAIISANLYSVLVGSTILFMFVVPFLMSYLIQRWKIRC
jgi:Ca2+-transporting ATPase